MTSSQYRERERTRREKKKKKKKNRKKKNRKKKSSPEDAYTYTRTELMMFLCKTNSIFCASLKELLLLLVLLLLLLLLAPSAPPPPSKEAADEPNGVQILRPWLSTSRTIIFEEDKSDDGDDAFLQFRVLSETLNGRFLGKKASQNAHNTHTRTRSKTEDERENRERERDPH